MISEQISEWLLKTSFEGSVLILVILAWIALAGRLLSPRWRVALWALAGLKLVIPACIIDRGLNAN